MYDGAAENEIDSALLRAVAEGDRSALGRLYDVHSPRLLALAVRMLRDAREGEDLVHDVFLEAWRHAADYDSTRGSVRAWLAVRLRSRALDRLKSAGYARTIALEPDHEEALYSPASTETGAHDAAYIQRALAQLSDDQRIVLELSYFEGLSLSEVATRLRSPIGTVKSRLARALALLRDEFGEFQGGFL